MAWWFAAWGRKRQGAFFSRNDFLSVLSLLGDGSVITQCFNASKPHLSASAGIKAQDMLERRYGRRVLNVKTLECGSHPSHLTEHVHVIFTNDSLQEVTAFLLRRGAGQGWQFLSASRQFRRRSHWCGVWSASWFVQEY